MIAKPLWLPWREVSSETAAWRPCQRCSSRRLAPIEKRVLPRAFWRRYVPCAGCTHRSILCPWPDFGLPRHSLVTGGSVKLPWFCCSALHGAPTRRKRAFGREPEGAREGSVRGPPAQGRCPGHLRDKGAPRETSCHPGRFLLRNFSLAKQEEKLPVPGWGGSATHKKKSGC